MEKKRFWGYSFLENSGLMDFLQLFLVDHLMELVFLRIPYEIAKLNISRHINSNSVWLFLMSFLSYSEHTSWVWKKMIFHWWLSATFIWQINIDCVSLWATEEIQGLCFKSQLFCCQGNPFPCLVESRIKLFCIKWGKLSLPFETTDNIIPFI